MLGEARYCAIDLVRALTDERDPRSLWESVKRSDHFARLRLVEAQFGDEWFSMLTLAEVMRLIQALHSPRAVRLQGWLADVGAHHVAEEDDPELAVRRVRQSYAAAGRTRPWIDQRLRSVSARQELVHEWNRRGIHDSEQYRALTNAMTEAIFGVDVNTFRRNRRVRQNLRDYLTDTELSLISLAEAVATSLHRNRNSVGMDELMRDVCEAGRIANQTRKQIDQVTNQAHAGGHQRVA
jgi:DNA-damage-inducible protein D